MKISFIEKIVGSVFFTGYIPFASGTFGSLAALAIYLIPGFENPTIMLISISIFFIIGIKIGDKFEKVYGKDPSQCTIDELVGMWISLLYIPKSFINILVVFIIWRAFDIIKPMPAKQVEEVKGGLGIMIDDVIAGIYTLMVAHVIIYFLKLF